MWALLGRKILFLTGAEPGSLGHTVCSVVTIRILTELRRLLQIKWYDMIYFLTAIGLSPGGSTHLHTNNT